MSQALYISVGKDTATRAVKKLLASTSPRALGEVVWPDALELTQRHLTAYKNKQGFPSLGFGEQLADKSYGAATDTGAKIVIHGQGARQLFEGGTITAVNKKTLCFGVTSESRGKSLPEMFGGAIPPRAQRSDDEKAKLKELRKMFVYTPSVTQPPHPDLLPTHEEYQATGMKSLRKAVKGGFN